MGAYLSTSITSPQILAAGGILAGTVTFISPTAGNFYLLMEQYNAELAFIPGSRAYLYQAVAGGAFVNNTIRNTTRARASAGVSEVASVQIAVPNTNCYLYIYLKERRATVAAGLFAVGTRYEITTLGTTDFTLIGAASNTLGVEFVASGVGAGTGTATPVPDPDTDLTVDYVVITLQSSSGGIDMGSLMNLMVTMMVIGMMMKMMTGAMKET